MKRFVDAVFNAPRAKPLEKGLELYLGLNDEQLDAVKGDCREIFLAQALKVMRSQGCIHPLSDDKTFDLMREALRAAPKAPERSSPCKFPS